MQDSQLWIALVFLLVFTYCVVWYFKNPYVSTTIASVVVVSWYFGFAGTILLPIDLTEQKMHMQNSSTLNDVWETVYWITFVMSWIILPFLISYTRHGEFTVKDRVKGAIRENLQAWATLLIIGSLISIYMVTIIGLNIDGFSGLLMAGSNTYALLWIIVLLGFGLVDIPRNLWRKTSREDTLQRLYFHAVQLHEEYLDATFLMEDIERDLTNLRLNFSSYNPESKEWIQMLLLFDNPKRYHSGTSMEDSILNHNNIPNMSNQQQCLSKQELVDLHERLKYATSSKRRTEQMWYDLCLECEELQDLVQEKSLPSHARIDDDLPLACIGNFFLKLHWQWKLVAQPKCYFFSSIICSIFSILILWSEVMMGTGVSLSPFSYLLEAIETMWATFLIASVVIVYLAICAYHSLFTLRILGAYRLRGNHKSDEISLLKNSIYQCRLQFSLGYNFLLLLNDNSLTGGTSFRRILNSMNVIKFFGTDFFVYAPVMIVLLCAFTLYDGFAHIVRYLNLEQYEQLIADSVEHKVSVKKGELLVRKGILGMSKQQRSGIFKIIYSQE